MRIRAFGRRAAALAMTISIMASAFAAAGSMELTMMDGVLAREMERTLVGTKASLDALNDSVPDRLPPEEVAAIEASDTPEGRRKAYIDNALSLIGDPLLSEALTLADGKPSDSLVITGDSVSGGSGMTLSWTLSGTVLPDIPAAEEARAAGRLGIRLGSLIPVLPRGNGNDIAPYLDCGGGSILGGVYAEYSWEPSMWAGLSVEGGLLFGCRNGSLGYMVPVAAGYTLLPFIDGASISMPIQVSGGFYLYGSDGGIVLSGPMAGIGYGIMIDILPGFSLELGIGFDCLFSFSGGEVSALLMLDPLSVTFGIGL